MAKGGAQRAVQAAKEHEAEKPASGPRVLETTEHPLPKAAPRIVRVLFPPGEPLNLPIPGFGYVEKIDLRDKQLPGGRGTKESPHKALFSLKVVGDMLVIRYKSAAGAALESVHLSRVRQISYDPGE